MIKKDHVNKFLDFLDYESYYFQTYKPRINGKYQNGVLAQEFCNKQRVVSLCEKLNGKGVICVALNYRPKGGSKSEDVKNLKVIAIDVDVKDERKVDYVSTLEDYAHAQEVANKIKEYLEKEYGFIINLVVKSGNGSQLLAKCDVPIIDLDVLKNKLTKLENNIKNIFSDKIVNIDAITKDINRRLKIPGTINKKDTYQKANRYSQIIFYKKVEEKDVKKNSDIIKGFKVNNETLTQLVNEIDKKEIINDEFKLIDIVKRDEKLHNLLTLDIAQLNKKYTNDNGTPKYKSESEVDMAIIAKLLFYAASDKLIDWSLTKRGGSWSTKSQQYRDRSIIKGKEFISRQKYDNVITPRTYRDKKENILNNIINNLCVCVADKIIKRLVDAKELNSKHGFSFDEELFQSVFSGENFKHTYFCFFKLGN